MDQKLLTDLCKSIMFKSQDSFDVAVYTPSVNRFQIPDDLLLVIPKLERLKESGLFQKIWVQAGSNSKLDDSFKSILAVWNNAKEQWDTLSLKIRNGTISFDEIKRQIYVFREDYERIKLEFSLMNDNDSSQWVDERIQQLKTFSLVDKCKKTALEIMQIQELFGFKGDFKPVKEILNLTTTRNVAMRKMDQSVLKTCTLLEDVTNKQIESLVAFRENKPLVDWLRDSMKAGLKELKVFVDLAYISAGEGDHEIHKVNCLHAATTGYAPLVFDCNEQCDYNMFLQSCQSVWRELKSNPNLPEMLRDTCRFLQWLKEVSQSHGSVEVTSLSQAGMINSKGVYRIGNLTREPAPPQLFADGRRCVWRRRGERYDSDNVIQHDRYGGGSVMVWAGIHGGGKTELVFIHGNMTAQRYCDEIITPVVIPFLQQHPGFLFQHDNTRPDTARLTTNLLERNRIQVLNWPPKSPDLSPIEHAWDLLGRRPMGSRLLFSEDAENQSNYTTRMSASLQATSDFIPDMFDSCYSQAADAWSIVYGSSDLVMLGKLCDCRIMASQLVDYSSTSLSGLQHPDGHLSLDLRQSLHFLLIDLSRVISLHVTPDTCLTGDVKDNVKDNVRKYSYNQLVDLQSRLMLVAGRAEKGKENVDLFMMILDGIVRLSKTYIKLISDGCVLFNCWKANFLCDVERDACAILDFGENSESLKGHRRKHRLEDFINALANVFEDCHMEWLKYLSDKRDQYLELNFFTISQLVFLQKELIKIGTDVKPSDLVFPLLSLIKPECSMSDIHHAMQSAKDEIFQIEQTEELAREEVEDAPMGRQDTEQYFIQELMKAGYTETLAQAAFNHVADADIDTAIIWCLDHENDVEFKSSAVDPVEVTSEPSEEQFSGWNSEEISFASRAASLVRNLPEQFKKDTSVTALTKNIEHIWKTFLGSVSSSVADYLSVEHLGIILRKLALSCDQSLNRKLPVQLKAKTPNLMVCQKSDMLNAVLHMYVEDPDQPLPRPDEVLLCTPETTFDEVDIFLRRAFFSPLGKIHCLAYADLLRYEIEEKIEKKFIDYIIKANAKDCDYKLVVLCSSENEFRARLVAALDRHRCQPPIIRVKNIKDYLTEKFTAVRVEKNTRSASHIDFSHSTVRVVKSKRAGIGKTLYKNRRVAELQELNPMFRDKDLSVSIPLYEKNVVMTQVVDKLLPCTLKPGQVFPRIFHLNISYEVQEGLDYLLFNLLILGKVSNEKGHIWLRSAMDLYLVEIIPISDVRDHRKTNVRLIHPIFEILPHVTCWSPQDSLQILTKTSRPDDYEKNDLLFDVEEFRSVVYQRPFQYLFRQESKASLSDIDPLTPQGDPAQCLITLLRHCGVPDPSWAELHHFVWFLNTQLCDFERSVFCSPELQDDLPGFSLFVLKFVIQMSRDFATRSLNMSEETPIGDAEQEEPDEDVISRFQMRRTWESSPHPYIFFNPDGQTMTFLGFNINRQTGDLIDQQTGHVLEPAIMAKNLQDSLIRNRVPLNENFDQLQRLQRLEKLCSVMPGVDFFYDPDPTYELTTDNVKKILAIFMRFRCNIPVLIMGETGCGKTRLVKFLCSLQSPPGVEVENMVIMKVHGGTTADDIIKKVHKAERLAQANAKINAHMYTVLFFDEANTTESIGLIKEIMCDGTMDGQPLQLSDKLKIVAACNPYRKHSDELIQRLEKAGLGYHVDAEKTTDKLGRVPMRRLVYRVQPLPQSMLPLVWDFGQLNTTVEELYIRQMVNHYIHDDMLPQIPGLVEVISTILIQSQNFMRDQQDECSFVSLRDVERVLKVMSWFYQQSQDNRTLFDMMEEEEREISDEEERKRRRRQKNMEMQTSWPDDLTKSLILALGVCYRASLRSRDDYDDHVTQFFQKPCSLPGGEDQFVNVITRCQDVFLENVQLEENIARNQALKENLFMMIICIELRIPLFLVGKPGSSKSLAKTIVSDAMQGNSARKELFKQLKQAQMVSFQCSPLSVAEGILGTFRQCAQFQKDKDLSRYVSIVVLDEVGLAEDSVRMPLKTLHPLLEDGCQGDEKPEPYKKVAFIGISNWALDPAKMNRGILVQREVPDEAELLESAKGICASREEVFRRIKSLLPQLADAYKAVFGATQQKREFFGLRDFYRYITQEWKTESYNTASRQIYGDMVTLNRQFHQATGVRITPQTLRNRLHAANFRGSAIGPEFVLMDDNTRSHRARIVRDYLEEETIERMDWPAVSPDRNPIEHI
ncbi:E3 ubiquitin-protein ligase rnf213-alpha-like [Gigantopelta aegis]|uniref:E3 ubiquitin-protein ligase rnf213-alpha-like n=1 Tax=Gigantopelta aegis TaxID=1735272 RepID=UPI001B88DD1B|nr:E3 ubiquitin-protein ligase rnf213-alpha-like [Gigantopelta aegis]